MARFRPVVVFDLDGTLADTAEDLLAAANACFAARRLDAPLTMADAATAFQGGRAMLRAGAARLGLDPDAVAEADYRALLAYYAAHIDTHTRLYPGTLPMLHALRDAGYVLAICTNKPEGLAQTLLTRLGIRDLFAALIGADTLPTRKPDPAPYLAAVAGAGGDPGGARSVLIGDTITDALTARAVGVPVVLVGFGPEGRDVARHQPDAILHHFDDLPGLIARLLPA
ncbi:HAD-IA family hydrolase [Paracoccus sp. p3-h83]|uniref:HAD-IA family hydrolase n=1 Tax=Paracoccus sp. p3-h83 TaxID=3342805 RepID=UPI0035B86DBE